jgi:putative zinc finger/helix-turn-helix YgiT family protein
MMREVGMSNMDCPTCHQKGKTYKGKYHYTESGLNNVWLVGVEIFECDCGENFAFIPCVQELHKLIAHILLKQENQLSGREIRFLRKHMGLKSKDFANDLGVRPGTISRWESGDYAPSKSFDKFIRLFYAANMELGDIAKKLVEDIFPKLKPGQKESPINFPMDKIIKEPCLVSA